MLLTPKKLSFLGLLLACTIVLILLGSVLEFNTLFFLAAASFCVGIAIRESSNRIGLGYYMACVILGFLLVPNKFYCVTFAAMGLYIVISEYSYDHMEHIKSYKNRRIILWVIKYIIFNVIYLPMLIFFPKLIYQGTIYPWMVVVLFLAGQIFLLIYDKVYLYFQIYIWGNIRKKLPL